MAPLREKTGIGSVSEACGRGISTQKPLRSGQRNGKITGREQVKRGKAWKCGMAEYRTTKGEK